MQDELVGNHTRGREETGARSGGGGRSANQTKGAGARRGPDGGLHLNQAGPSRDAPERR